MSSYLIRLVAVFSLLILALAAFVASCEGDMGTRGVDTSHKLELWLNRLSGPSSKVVILDGSTLEPIDSATFGQYSYEDGLVISGTNLAVLSRSGATGDQAATWVIDLETRDTLAIRDGIGEYVSRISPDGKHIGYGNGDVRILSLPDLATVAELQMAHSGFVFDPIRNRLVAPSKMGGDSITIWDLSTGGLSPTKHKISSPAGTELFSIGTLTYLPHSGNIAISYAGEPKSGTFEADSERFQYIRDWIYTIYQARVAHFVGKSKIVRIVEVLPQWTTNGNFWFELIDQATLKLEKTIPQSDIRQYISGDFTADYRAIASSPDGNWIFIVIPDDRQQGSYIYKIDLRSFTIQRVKYLPDANCIGLMVFERRTD